MPAPVKHPEPAPVVDPPVPPGPPPAAVKLEAVLFEYDAFTLDAAALEALERIYQVLAKEQGTFEVEGYCDERGDDRYNISLGESRAQAVVNWLVARGIEGRRLKQISYGREFPADPGHSPEAWRLNRRVEIVPAGSPGPGVRRRAAGN
ncbi:OmpA family protein [Geomonas paludis]|nr:OmpA family protein [Geomonas paludis]UPU38214.1 OmpA family protein [Geomonas paludis]